MWLAQGASQWKGAVTRLTRANVAVAGAAAGTDAVDLPVLLVGSEKWKMESQRQHNFRDRFLEIQLITRDTAEDLVAHGLPQRWERPKTRTISQRPTVGASPLLAGVPAPRRLSGACRSPKPLHKMAKR